MQDIFLGRSGLQGSRLWPGTMNGGRHGKLNPARLVARQIALSDVTDTRQRMARLETVGFEVIRRFT